MPSPDFDQALVDHAVRCWDAERENAARLSARETLLLTAIGALFGLGLFRVDWFRGKEDVSRVLYGPVVIITKVLLALALLFFGLAFVEIMGRRKYGAGTKPTASHLLGLPATMFTEGPPSGADARKLVFTRVYKAFADLQARNAVRKHALDRGQQWFLLGLGLIAIALITYTFFSQPL